MTAKEYLKQAKTLDMEINAKVEELHQLKLKAACVQGVAITERVSSSRGNSSNKAIDRIVDLQNEINAEIDKLVSLKLEIRSKINHLKNPLHRVILIDYYINNKSWEKIAEDNNYSRRYIFKLHGYALNDFRKEDTKRH